jgi:hypothetical protein
MIYINFCLKIHLKVSATGVVDTVANLPPVSLTPVANLPPVSTTLAKLVAKFAAGVVDTGGIFAAGVIDTRSNFVAGPNLKRSLKDTLGRGETLSVVLFT